MDRLLSSIGTTSTAAPATTTEFVTNSLSSRLPQFSYDPENGCTFNMWFSRYDDMIAKDGSTLDDAAKARLIVSKLDAASYARFTNHILPSKPSDISMEETVKTLKELFGHNTSVFARRYAYLRTQCNGESLRDYTGMVNQRHELAEFNAVTGEQMKCLVWICGLSAPEYADIRTRALRKMEEQPQTTLKELSAEVQQFVDIRHDAKLLGNTSSPVPVVNAVATTTSKRQRDPPSPCYRCGGSQWAKDCEFVNKKCNACSLVGHKKGFCKNFNKRKQKRTRTNHRRANNVVVAASTTSAVSTVTRIYRNVTIYRSDATRYQCRRHTAERERLDRNRTPEAAAAIPDAEVGQQQGNSGTWSF